MRVAMFIIGCLVALSATDKTNWITVMIMLLAACFLMAFPIVK